MKSRLLLAFAVPAAFFAGCSSSTVTPSSDAGSSDAGGDTPAQLALASSVSCKDSIDAIYADPGALTAGMHRVGRS